MMKRFLFGLYLLLLFSVGFWGCSHSSNRSLSENKNSPPSTQTPPAENPGETTPGSPPPVEVPPTPTSSVVKVSITLTGVGEGVVNFGNGECVKTNERITCSEEFPQETLLELEAIPKEGYLFQGWYGGSCRGTGKCVLKLTKETQINAAFVMIPFATNNNSSLNTFDLFLTTTNRSRVLQLTHHPAAYLKINGIQFSPDGESVLFRKNVSGITPVSFLYLIRLDPEGKVLREIKLVEAPKGMVFSEPEWNGVHNQVLYHVQNQNLSNIETIKFDNNQYQPFTIIRLTNVTRCFNRFPRLSSDGKKIFFFSNCNIQSGQLIDEIENLHLWTVNTDLADPFFERITENYSKIGLELLTSIENLSDLEISPDGNELIFANENAPIKRIWSFNLVTQEMKLLTPSNNREVKFLKPRWSEDGTQIFYLSNRDNRYPYDPDKINRSNAFPTEGISNLWFMNRDGSNLSSLTNYEGFNPWSTFDCLKRVKNSEGSSFICLLKHDDLLYIRMFQEDGSYLPRTVIEAESKDILINF